MSANDNDSSTVKPVYRGPLPEAVRNLVRRGLEGHQPEGFRILGDANTLREGELARSRDSGRSNVSVDPGGRAPSYGLPRYVVEEEKRRFGSNDSLQRVELHSVVDVSTRAFLIDKSNGSERSLFADSDGRVYFNIKVADAQIGLEITDDMAKIGVTARDIREMQYRIAYDGEVDRVEQQQIKNLIDRAKRVAFPS